MKKIDFILSRIAAEHHTTPENVRAEMEKALQEAQQSTDPEIRAKWALISRKGSHLTLEEFLDYAGNYLTRF